METSHPSSNTSLTWHLQVHLRKSPWNSTHHPRGDGGNPIPTHGFWGGFNERGGKGFMFLMFIMIYPCMIDTYTATGRKILFAFMKIQTV